MTLNPEIIGYIAAFFTTAAYLPQTMKVVRERHTKSISLGMFIMISTGIALWAVYGVLIGSTSLILANVISLAMTLTILVMKIRLG